MVPLAEVMAAWDTTTAEEGSGQAGAALAGLEQKAVAAGGDWEAFEAVAAAVRLEVQVETRDLVARSTARDQSRRRSQVRSQAQLRLRACSAS